MAETMIFDVKGMTCDNCVRHVTEAVQSVQGVREAKVDLAGAEAKVEGDSLDPKAIIAAIEEEGYEASVRAA
jgi:copper chaperone CopZ